MQLASPLQWINRTTRYSLITKKSILKSTQLVKKNFYMLRKKPGDMKQKEEKKSKQT